MAEEATSAGWAPLTAVSTVVDNRIRTLQEGVLANRSAQVAALARLRRAAGKRPGEVSDVFEYTTADVFAPRSCGDEPTAAEAAAHIVLTLYATHQQSQSERMHQRGPGLGKALRRLLPEQPREDQIYPVHRRFQALGATDDLTGLSVQLRGLVQLLRAQHVPLDYALLTDELVQWQQDKRGPSRVRLRWGRDFYRAAPKIPSIDSASL